MKITRQKFATALAMLLTLVVLGSLLILYRPMNPIRQGTSGGFWQCTLGVSLRGASGRRGHGFIKDGFAYYSPFAMGGDWVYRVPVDKVMSDFPEVIKILDTKVADPANSESVEEGYRYWKSRPQYLVDGINGLLRAVTDARVAREIQQPWHYPGVATASLYFPPQPDQQVARSHFYWANFVFEFMLLVGIAWFLLWPAIRGLTLRRWFLHFAIAPFIFFLPTWFGYCAADSVDGNGPTGGILYPLFIQSMQHHACYPNADWEISFLKTLPKFLEPINQTSEDLDKALEYKESYYYFTGPIQAALGSALLCSMLFIATFPGALTKCLRRRRARRLVLHAFEILDPQPRAPEVPSAK